MQDPIPKEIDLQSQKTELQRLLNEITSRDLDARNINTYADDALEDLIILTQKAVGDYRAADPELSGLEQEDLALQRAGLDPNTVELTLDHISDVAESTRRLDALVMKKTQLVDRVIVPPDSGEAHRIAPGDGSFEKPKEMIPKLKTLLLLLEKGLDIDIEDDEAVKITAGALRPNMMRGASYNLVEIPSLNRIVLVCDEVGNTTYMFDTDACDEYGITAEYLAEQMKPEIDDLLEGDARLGRRINYSQKYVDQLGVGLTQLFDEHGQEDRSAAIEILKPKAPPAPEGYLSLAGIKKRYGISPKVISRGAAELSSQLGETKLYRFGSQTTEGFSPEQIESIIAHLDLAPFPPDGYLPMGGIVREYKTNYRIVAKVVAELNDELGTIQVYRFPGATTEGFSPEQIESIIAHLDLAPPPPDGYLSVSGIAKDYKFDKTTVARVVAKLGSSLGDAELYRFGNRKIIGYSPKQIELIVTHLNLATPLPDSYLSVRGIAREYGIGENTIARAIAKLGDELGEVQVYRLAGGPLYKGYSPKQQRQIFEHINRNSTRVKLGAKAIELLSSELD